MNDGPIDRCTDQRVNGTPSLTETLGDVLRVDFRVKVIY